MIRRFYLILCCMLACGLVAMAQDSVQTERIINFDSDISIDTSGLVKVTEHIRVYAAGNHILHGLLRTIPLYRDDRLGTRKKIDFEITDVKKNGQTENYKTKEEDGSRKIYIGESSTILDAGVYEYAITYQSKGHVGFFKDYDELYWNVTGNDWTLEIEKASATITLPPGAKAGNIACYTGVRGSTDKSCSDSVTVAGPVSFAANGSLKPSEGFTVAVAFTAGIIKRPGKLELFYQDYFSSIAGVAMVLVFASIYYILWYRKGRDPEQPVVVPRFHIPRNWSPALLRYFDRKSYDDKAAAVGLINMAVKGAVKINVFSWGAAGYMFEKQTDEPKDLAAEEQIYFNKLFTKRKTIKTTSSNASILAQARQQFETSVKSQLKLTDYYKKNTSTSVWMGLLALAALIPYLIASGDAQTLFALFLVPFIMIGVFFFTHGLKQIKKSVSAGIISIIVGIFFGGIPAVGGIALIGHTSPVAIIIMLVMVVMYIVFVRQIKAYTTEGILIKSEIEGFKLYLSTAEERRLNLLNPPELTPQTYEKFLPYAVALNLENAWGEKFSDVLDQIAYTPQWYSGDDGYRSFTNSVPSSFYGAVSSSPATSSSGSSGSSSGSSGSSSWSSGSSGGGSSGGGGGGGGGGGW